jgi:hypothetical protein
VGGVEDGGTVLGGVLGWLEGELPMPLSSPEPPGLGDDELGLVLPELPP